MNDYRDYIQEYITNLFGDDYDYNLKITEERITFTVDNLIFSCSSDLPISGIKSRIDSFHEIFE